MIRYYIPADGDDAQHPNIFHLPGQQSQQRPPTLRDVRQHFPLPGAYHFRFKTRLPSGGPVVWIDVMEDSAPVPAFDNGVVLAKVTRLAAGAPPATAAGNHHATTAAATVSSSSSASRAPSNAGSGSKPAATVVGGLQAPEADPFGLFAESGGSAGATPTRPPQPQQQASPQQAGAGGGQRGADLLNFDAFAAAPPAPGMAMGAGGGMMPPRGSPGMAMGGGRMSPQAGMMGRPMGPPRGMMPPRPSYPPSGGAGGGGWM